MAAIENVKGDLFKALDELTSSDSWEKHPEIVIAHCCNDLGAWGAGFVLELTKFDNGQSQTDYEEWASEANRLPDYRVGDEQDFGLGKVRVTLIEDDDCDTGVYVANMVGQAGTISADNPKPLSYAAIGSAMFSTMQIMRDDHGKHGVDSGQSSYHGNHYEIWCPRFGSARAGGNWFHIEEMIEETWVKFGVNVKVFKR